LCSWICFCHSAYYFKAIFGYGLDTAVLQSPGFNESSKTCLRFHYQISTPKITLKIFVRKKAAGSEFQPSGTVTFSNQKKIGSRSKATVELPDGSIQLQVVADKTGVSSNIHFVKIDNIQLIECPITGF